MTKITATDWEAWVDLQPIQPTPGGTLHVTSEVDTSSTDMAHLQKRVPQGINERILLLDLEVNAGTIPAKNPQKMHFTENLADKNQYDSIEIYYEGELEATIENIQEVH